MKCILCEKNKANPKPCNFHPAHINCLFCMKLGNQECECEECRNKLPLIETITRIEKERYIPREVIFSTLLTLQKFIAFPTSNDDEKEKLKQTIKNLQNELLLTKGKIFITSHQLKQSEAKRFCYEKLYSQKSAVLKYVEMECEKHKDIQIPFKELNKLDGNLVESSKNKIIKRQYDSYNKIALAQAEKCQPSTSGYQSKKPKIDANSEVAAYRTGHSDISSTSEADDETDSEP